MLRRTATATTAGALALFGIVTPGAAEAASPNLARQSSEVKASGGHGCDFYGNHLDATRSTELTPSKSSQHPDPAVTGEKARADFDGDGISDLVSAATTTTPVKKNPLNSVVILYSSDWASEYGKTHWRFGTNASSHMSLTVGNFNKDGFDDLAIGLPYSTVDGHGSLYVFYGSGAGLGWDWDDAVCFEQDSHPGIPGANESGDQFGRSVAAGDINHDGFDDLVVGSPGEAIGSTARAGMIHVLWGSAGRLTDRNVVGLSQADASVPGGAETGDEFGMSLAVGDVTGDGYQDIAVGAPGENGYGMATLLKGAATGIDPTGATALVGPRTSTVTPRRFGQSMLIPDTTGDGKGDIITGAPDATVNGRTTAGAVSVHPGTSSGLTTTGQTYWHQDSTDVPGSAESGDRFGTRLLSGQVVGDSRTDLVVGVQNEAVGSIGKAGAVVVLPGAATTSGLTGTGSNYIDQNSTNVPGAPEPGDQFGSSMQLVTVNGHSGLLIGATGEQVSQTDLPGSGMLTWFDVTDGNLIPSSEVLTGPQISLSNELPVYRLGLNSVTN